MAVDGRRRLRDSRLKQASARCPDDNSPLVPTGQALSDVVWPTREDWYVEFFCPLHSDERLSLWRPELQPLIDQVLHGVHIADLPLLEP